MELTGWSTDRFIEPTEHYICGICREVFKDAMSLNCGHTFCKCCITKSDIFFQNKCPVCRAFTIELVPDFSTRMKINGMAISCLYKEKGCEYKIALSRMTEHEICCPYKPVSCIQCKEEICFIYLEKHMNETCNKRLLDCTTCKSKIPYDEFKVHETETCPMIQTNCSYCNFPCFRKYLSDHSNECQLIPIQCTYYKYGCKHLCSRKDMKKHLLETDHLRLVTDSFEEFKDEMKEHLNCIHQEGPFRVRGHNHSLLLCFDGEEEICSLCHFYIERNKSCFFYKCTKGCAYQLCTSCLRNTRTYHSKKDNLSFFFLQ